MGQQSNSDEVKEVYARFGLAYYHSEVLHRGLCNFYALSQIPEEGAFTRLRVEEHLSVAFSKTLGQIVKLVLPLLPDDLANNLNDVILKRNFLAHYFWFERINLTMTSEGISRLVEELSLYSKEFQALDSEIEKLTIQLCSRLGLPEEAFEEALDAAYRGEDMEPLWKQRRLKKEEIIVGVYNVPTEKGGTTIVFKTEDGCFWQLCDIGLGWTFYDQIESDWKPIDSLIDLLPARINPRPKIEKPWHFEISFNPNVTFVIRPGTSCNNFKCEIRRNT